MGINLPNKSDMSNTMFEEYFFEYYNVLCRYSYKIIQDKDSAEDIVMDLFFALLTKKPVQLPSRTYLFAAVYHASLNWMRHTRIKERYLAGKYVELMEEGLLLPPHIEEDLYLAQLQQGIEKALSNLPDKCKQIFEMSRMQNLKNKEIADILNISENTVERQISIALKKIRLAIKGWMLLLF